MIMAGSALLQKEKKNQTKKHIHIAKNNCFIYQYPQKFHSFSYYLENKYCEF